MGKLAISADPFHQQFVPIERCRQAARVAQEVLGPGRVQVRWRDWLADGFDTGEMPQQDRDELFARYAAGGRDRWNGRAADTLAAQVAELLQTEEGREKREERRERREEGRSKRLISSPFSPLPSSSCGEALLRGRHVHVDGNGIVSPGVCAGIVLGRVVLGKSGDASSCNKKNALTEAAVQALPCGSRLNGSNCGSRLNEVPAGTICELWHGLEQDHAARPVVGALARGGPAALLEAAKAVGYVPRSIYAGKCHLCREIRRYLYQKGLHRDELGPPGLYD